MPKIYKTVTELIGNTPLFELVNYNKAGGFCAKILAKLEYLNPAGSIKDRVARAMIEDAESRGLLKKGTVIVEPTSGNTGIGLAAVAASKGYRLILTMPENMSLERRKLLKAYGAELVLTDGAKGMAGAIEKAEEIVRLLQCSMPNAQCGVSDNSPFGRGAHEGFPDGVGVVSYNREASVNSETAREQFPTEACPEADNHNGHSKEGVPTQACLTGRGGTAFINARPLPLAFMPSQFKNPANPAAHEAATGPEIWRDTEGKVDFFVCCVGTGGTISGVGRYLKAQAAESAVNSADTGTEKSTGGYLKTKNPDIKVIAVEPAGSPVLSGGKAGSHAIQGIGAGFIPEVLDTQIYDEIITVSDNDTFAAARKIAKTDGILIGISSGAALSAASQLALRPENKGKRIVVIFPDSGERYLSTALFEE